MSNSSFIIDDNSGFNEPVEIEPRPDYKPKPKLSTYIPPEGIKGVTPYVPATQFDASSGSFATRYTEISLFPLVKMGLDLRIAGALASGWSIKIQNDYDLYPTFEALDKLILHDILDQLGELQDDFNNIIKEILYQSMVYGFTIAEKSFDNVKSQWEMHRLKVLPSFQFDIYTDAYNIIEKLFHLASGRWVQEDVLEKFVIATYPFDINGNPYGRSELQSIYNDVKLLEILEQYRAKAIQYLCVKPIIYRYNPERDDTIVGAARNSVYNLESFSIISLPLSQNPSDPSGAPIIDDILEVLEDRASSDGLAAVENVIDQIQKRILNALGIPDDLGFTTQPIGSYAKSQTELTMFNSRILNDQSYLEGIINRQIIPSLVHYNWRHLPDTYVLPKFQFHTIEEDTHATIVTTLVELITAGIISPNEKWIRDLLELPKDATTEEETKEETKEKAGFSSRLFSLLRIGKKNG